MQDHRGKTCCFSGYRIEKMPFRAEDTAAVQALCGALDRAVRDAAQRGYTRFLSGMSTGFDLWAAEAVLRAREHWPVELLCAVPFDRQADSYPAAWKRRFNACLLAADRVYALSRTYYAGCYAARNNSWWTPLPCSSAILTAARAARRRPCAWPNRPGSRSSTWRRNSNRFSEKRPEKY